MSPSPGGDTGDAPGATHVTDYDRGGYDYRSHWQGRDYERWAEERVLRRLLGDGASPRWLVDFGGGFGRNALVYRGLVEHAVVCDYSAHQLQRAADTLGDDVAGGRVLLLRTDLYHLPFIDNAFDTAIVIRVLHHLTAIDVALREMARTVARRWLLDVPIKHHALGRARALLHRRHHELKSWVPQVSGSTDDPFYTFRLEAIRAALRQAGWNPLLAASVNNLRRWDQHLPAAAVRALRPLAQAAEVSLERAGRGWWGPSQFIDAHRRTPGIPALQAAPAALSGAAAELARRLICPRCHGELEWTADRASCTLCARSYPRVSAHWDFVTALAG